MQKLIVVLILVGLLWFGYNKMTRAPEGDLDRASVAAVTAESTSTPVSTAAPEAYRCDGRTHCSQMRSCAEATYFVKHCPGTQMDGNGDGVPCERQWCR